MNPTALLSSVLGIAIFVAVVLVALKVAQSIFGTGSRRATATEVAAKLVAYPTASDGVLRRRFVRALTTQHVVMPSGERLAFSDLTVRVAPEDLHRLDPDGDLDRLGEDAATLYRTHAEREGWALPGVVEVTVEVDPGLRSGWVPPARGTRRRDPVGVLGVRREEVPVRDEEDDRPTWLGWDAVAPQEPAPAASAPVAAPSSPVPGASVTALRSRPVDAPTAVFDQVSGAPRPFAAPTVTVAPAAPALRLERGTEGGGAGPGAAEGTVALVDSEAVLGRLPGSPIAFPESEVSGRHAVVRWRAGRWQVGDLGSTNGTTVDGQPVAEGEWVTVSSGSIVALAGVRVVVSQQSAGTVRRDAVRSH